VTKRVTKYEVWWWVGERAFHRSGFWSRSAAWNHAKEIPGARRIDVVSYQADREAKT